MNRYTDNIVSIRPWIDTPERGLERQIHREPVSFYAGEWRVYPLAGELLRNGQFVHVEPKAMDVLTTLVSRAGQVVTRAELLEENWEARFQVADESLTRCIAALRKAFDDSPKNSRYIRTIPKRGYQFVAPVFFDRPDGG